MSTKQVYFIGIAGIGMSALAQHAIQMGFEVFGYDRNANDQTSMLEAMGASITYEIDDVSLIDQLNSTSVVVRTSAVPLDHLHCRHAVSLNIRVIKRAELLAQFLKDFKAIAVAGTHGKTSTSSFLAHFLKMAHLNFSAFLGGVSAEFGSNYFNSGTDYAVVEADEFDRSFLTLTPEISLITNIEVDHLDCYADLSDLENAFLQFQSQTLKQCVVHESLSDRFRGFRYGLSDRSHYQILTSTASLDFSAYLLKTPKAVYAIQSNTTGLHNALNAVAAFAVAAQFTEETKLIEAFQTLPTIQRRFNVVVDSNAGLYIDDYAHHPSELAALHSFAKGVAPKQKLALIFQPHLYSRTLHLKEDFIRALSLFDRLIILPIYAAREQPNDLISSAQLVLELGAKAEECAKEEVLNRIKQLRHEVLITAGAGDIADLVEPIKKWMTNECLV
jgi:UDP-N-acetylmuramate--alanine ligase